MSDNPYISTFRVGRLPPILARDYFRNVILPHLKLYGALLFLAAIVFGVIR